MSAIVEVSPTFIREAKKLIKRYPSLKIELDVLFSELELHPEIGTPLGDGVYKVRLGISSKGKGKSGGAPVLTYYRVEKNSVLAFSIYSKGEKDNISKKEIQQLLKDYKH